MASMREIVVPLLAVWAIFTAKITAQEKNTPDMDKPATVIFRLPADAVLTVDNVKTTKTGSERKFITAPLQTGIRYFYNVQAEWEPNNYTKITRPRKVIVRAGERVEVDLRQQDPKQPDKIFVRYVPTPQSVVDAMLKMGKATKDDIVYDLGCGDGRIPVTAVAKFGAQRGVGIDLDPQRIKECEENARAAGPEVEKKLKFRQEDVLKLKDLGDATLVTLYLGEDLNRQLKPILQKTLKPGSRIVSHRFLMGDWKPDRTETVMFEGVEYKLHLWIVPGENPNRASEKQP